MIHDQLTHEGVDMLNHRKKDIVLSALDIVIDGVSSSEANEEMRTAGVYIAGLIIADTKGMLEQDTRKAVLSIIEMAER
ncbi:hypothetical protein ACPV4Y_06625 [Vibrio harveyi]|uniref:hypothetical protein n=1 Tax=Vibrio jasicida TaxID=766224 RepID=UPI004068362A